MNSHRVLLVEDYPANILVATTLLEDFGYHYDVATSGEDALNKIMAQDYHVALMDVELGDMCGCETTRRVRSWEECAPQRTRLPIIAMTAHALTGDREKCIAAGMDDYISKPFDAEELRSKLARYTQAMAA